jgi:hypothetical protein
MTLTIGSHPLRSDDPIRLLSIFQDFEKENEFLFGRFMNLQQQQEYEIKIRALNGGIQTLENSEDGLLGFAKQMLVGQGQTDLLIIQGL